MGTGPGASWRQVGLNGHFVGALAASPMPGVFWAATSSQVFRSGDDGGTWRDLSGGPARSVEGFAFDPLDPRRVYAPGSQGVWLLEGGP